MEDVWKITMSNRPTSVHTNHCYYQTNTTKTATVLDYFHIVYMWDNPKPSLIFHVLKYHRKREAQYNPKTKRLYLHQTLRRTVVVRDTETGEVVRSRVENYACQIEIKREHEEE